MERKTCPICNRKLPLFMFRADLKIQADKEKVVFQCPKCKAKLKAISNKAHQNNFFWVVATPILALVVLISLHSMIPSYIRPLYYFFGVVLALVYPVITGQHKMDIEPYLEKQKD